MDYGAAISWHKVGTNRSFGLGTVHQQLNSDHRERTDQLFADVGYRFGDTQNHYTEPFAALAYARQHGDTATEHGSAAALITQDGNADATFSTLGLRWAVNGEGAQWYGSVAWRHAFGSGVPAARQAFLAGGSDFTVEGLPIASNAAVIGLGARLALSKHTHLDASYSGSLAGNSRDNGAKILLSVDF
jgi:outer membrane autotransporter protein